MSCICKWAQYTLHYLQQSIQAAGVAVKLFRELLIKNAVLVSQTSLHPIRQLHGACLPTWRLSINKQLRHRPIQARQVYWPAQRVGGSSQQNAQRTVGGECWQVLKWALCLQVLHKGGQVVLWAAGVTRVHQLSTLCRLGTRLCLLSLSWCTAAVSRAAAVKGAVPLLMQHPRGVGTVQNCPHGLQQWHAHKQLYQRLNTHTHSQGM
jgi:hypothetical protein